MEVCYRSPSRRAFTLIEMLVVIALIAILAAILFPVFQRVQENGRRTACAANLKQIGQAVRMFADDNRNRLPPIWNYTYTFASTVTMSDGSTTFQGVDQLRMLTQSLHPYLRDYRVWFCKSDRLRSEANAMLLTLYPGGNVRWGQDDAAKAGVISFAYATNTNNTYYGTPDPYCPARDRQADMVNILPDPNAPPTDRQGNKPDRSSSKVCLLVDNWVPVWEQVDPTRNKGPHNDASNVLFIDGHVESKPTGTWGDLHPPLRPLQ